MSMSTIIMLLPLLVFALFRISLAQVTCPDLGDFNPDPPFTGWPNSSCPGDEGFDLVFTMFGRRDLLGRTFDKLTVPNIFDPELDTIFLIHGRGTNGDDAWLDDMKNALTDAHDVNVVVVGWGGTEGAEDSYALAAADTRTVGAETAEVMLNLVLSGDGTPIRMHFVGHDLGAHAAGHAGRWADVRGLKPQRITGLDPAGPNFIDNPDRTVGLYNDCANFVDIIHTDDVYGSTPDPDTYDVHLGDQDFFPNGGATQPGCTLNQCDSNRAYAYFQESITNNCMDATLICTNSSELLDSCAPCEPSCPRMGYTASPATNGRYFMTTMDEAPYC